MGRFTKDNGGDFVPAPAGTHPAVCVELIDLGTQHSQFGKKNQVMIRWELVDEKMEDGNPFIVGGFYTNSLNEQSKLRPMLETWRGRPFTEAELDRFDLQNILGAPCLVSVIHDKGKAKISGVSALPKAMPKPMPKNKPKAFWIDEWDSAAFEELPEGFRNMIKKSDEYAAREMGVPASREPGEDDAPW